jgi:hypothetical protein
MYLITFSHAESSNADLIAAPIKTANSSKASGLRLPSTGYRLYVAKLTSLTWGF